MFNIGKFLARKGLTHSALAEKLNCSHGLVGMWASGKAVPSYEKCVELLQNGMTVSELFGEEVAKNAAVFPLTEEEIKVTAENFEQKVGSAIVNLVNKGFFKVKQEA
jgi:transcriptional regulator with XRE-family HTH domain